MFLLFLLLSINTNCQQENNPPTPSAPIGASNGNINTVYYFSASATDPDGDTSDWSAFKPSGSTDSMPHAWSAAGTYTIKAQAKDSYGKISGWSSGHQITISGGVQGSLKWAFATGNYLASSPSIGSDSTIYIGSWDRNIYAINPNGSLKWSFTVGGSVTS
jgi:outer membrane protein assembly factor BamB